MGDRRARRHLGHLRAAHHGAGPASGCRWTPLARAGHRRPGARLEVTFDDLTPDTLYNVVLVAEDKHGNLNHRYGQFRTLQRHVELTFTSIHALVNDADKYKVNKGEVEWFFEVENDWIEDFHRGVAKINLEHHPGHARKRVNLTVTIDSARFRKAASCGA